MTNDQVPVDESEEGKRKPQRNEAGNEDPTATSIEETKKEEYYEEGNGLTLICSVRLTPNFRRHCIRPKKFCLPCVSACRMTVL
jgi:hypothetical protein